MAEEEETSPQRSPWLCSEHYLESPYRKRAEDLFKVTRKNVNDISFKNVEITSTANKNWEEGGGEESFEEARVEGTVSFH